MPRIDVAGRSLPFIGQSALPSRTGRWPAGQHLLADVATMASGLARGQTFLADASIFARVPDESWSGRAHGSGPDQDFGTVRIVASTTAIRAGPSVFARSASLEDSSGVGWYVTTTASRLIDDHLEARRSSASPSSRRTGLDERDHRHHLSSVALTSASRATSSTEGMPLSCRHDADGYLADSSGATARY